jgi:hypothetical protein
MAAKDDKVNEPVVPVATAVVDPVPRSSIMPVLMPDYTKINVFDITPEQRRRLIIREELMRAARENADDIIITAESRYSRDLSLLQGALNDYLKEQPGRNPVAIYLDPAKFDAAMALGFEETSAIGRVLYRQGLALDPTLIDDSAKLGAIADQTLGKQQSRFGIQIYTQDGASHPGVGILGANVIVPSADHAVTYPIEGLSRRENVDFTNLHEGWHAKDAKYTVKGEVTPGLYQKIAVYNMVVFADEKEEEARQVFTTRHRAEVLADVGAVGDMIRGGKDISVLDKVREWRRSDPGDYRHMSVQALDGLKSEIEKIGIDKFRKLPNRSVRELYYNVVENNAIDAAALKAAAQYDLNELVPETRAEMEQKAKTDRALAKGIAFLGLVGEAAQKTAADNASKHEHDHDTLSPAEQAVKDQLDKWDPLQALQDRAFKDSGRITPATLVKAYPKVSDEIRDNMETEPDNSLHDLKLSKLQAAFIDGLPNIDYVEANKRFGLDIVEVEPALEKHRAPAKTVGRPVMKPGG